MVMQHGSKSKMVKVTPRTYSRCCTLGPVVSAQWLLSEYDDDQETFFGLCDLGQGFPELGYVALADFDELTGYATPEINGAFKASARLSTYVEAARLYQHIVLEVKPDQT